MTDNIAEGIFQKSFSAKGLFYAKKELSCVIMPSTSSLAGEKETTNLTRNTTQPYSNLSAFFSKPFEKASSE